MLYSIFSVSNATLRLIRDLPSAAAFNTPLKTLRFIMHVSILNLVDMYCNLLFVPILAYVIIVYLTYKPIVILCSIEIVQ